MDINSLKERKQKGVHIIWFWGHISFNLASSSYYELYQDYYFLFDI